MRHTTNSARLLVDGPGQVSDAFLQSFEHVMERLTGFTYRVSWSENHTPTPALRKFSGPWLFFEAPSVYTITGINQSVIADIYN